MNTYISLLRGINVSGQNKIKMAALKEVYEYLKFENITTYIQSGNVVFKSSDDASTLKKSIEVAIKNHFDLDIPVLILTVNQLESIYKALPFPNIDIELEGSKIIVFFLSNSIRQDKKEVFDAYISHSEHLVMGQNVIYLYCPDGSGKSKLTNKLIEQKLKLTSTARNIKTVNKLLSISNS
jgi:uncharacterized protein (DUF1697 family)